jgi:hypothetical protein
VGVIVVLLQHATATVIFKFFAAASNQTASTIDDRKMKFLILDRLILKFLIVLQFLVAAGSREKDPQYDVVHNTNSDE